jgi:hypothetical protein
MPDKEQLWNREPRPMPHEMKHADANGSKEAEKECPAQEASNVPHAPSLSDAACYFFVGAVLHDAFHD